MHTMIAYLNPLIANMTQPYACARQGICKPATRSGSRSFSLHAVRVEYANPPVGLDRRLHETTSHSKALFSSDDGLISAAQPRLEGLRRGRATVVQVLSHAHLRHQASELHLF